MRSAVTVSLVEEARGGPFVFWHGLENAFETASALGFDAVEIFAPGPDLLSAKQVQKLCQSFDLKVAAVGTGAGMVKHGLSLTDADASKRKGAVQFISQMIQFGSELNAPAIIGSMQGRWTAHVNRNQAIDYLAAALDELGDCASRCSTELFYEPLNRYETNLVNTIAVGSQLLHRVAKPNIKLLADLFHMNIEESNIEQALLDAGPQIGHIHFVDSNRQAAGFGHIDYAPITRTLQQMNYQGYLSAEALPLPDSFSAAQQTINAIKAIGKFLG